MINAVPGFLGLIKINLISKSFIYS